MDLDELIFEAFAPRAAQAVVAQLEPLELPRLPQKRGCGVHATGAVVLCLVATLACWYTQIPDLYARLDSVSFAMCGGNLDFVVGENAAIASGVMVATTPWEDGPLSQELDPTATWKWNSVHQAQAMDSIGFATIDVAYVSKSTAEFKTYMKAKAIDIVGGHRMHACIDEVLLDAGVDGAFSASQHHLWWLRDVYGMPDATSCQDFSGHCGDQDAAPLRFICGRTCECHSPRSGLLWLDGCSSTCRYERYLRLQAMSCEDVDAWSAQAVRETMSEMVSQFINEMETHEASVARWAGHRELLSAYGCDGVWLLPVVQENYLWKNVLCAGSERYSSLRPFCPSLCECGPADEEVDCPGSCSGDAVAVFPSCSVGLCPPDQQLVEHKIVMAEWGNSTCGEQEGFMMGRMNNGAVENCESFRWDLSETCCSPRVAWG
jgi:hypothetical protein